MNGRVYLVFLLLAICLQPGGTKYLQTPTFNIILKDDVVICSNATAGLHAYKR